jgi:hypothetical protein
MKEKLHQYWSALKEVKTLAMRLQVMPKFNKIFEGLPFNDLLYS